MRQLEFESAFRAEWEYRCHRSISSWSDDGVCVGVDDDDGRERCALAFVYANALSFPYEYYAKSHPSLVGDDDDGTMADADGCECDECHDDGAIISLPPRSQIESYESGMQYVTISQAIVATATTTTMTTTAATPSRRAVSPIPALEDVFEDAIKRCSLVRVAFRIAAASRTYEGLAVGAMRNGSFLDLTTTTENDGNGDNEDDRGIVAVPPPTWSIRLRRYGIPRNDDNASNNDDDDGQRRPKLRRARFGKNARSPLREERGAILSMANLVRSFGGKVDLANPECGIYILEGLKRPPRHAMSSPHDVAENSSNGTNDVGGGDIGATNEADDGKVLARVVARGPKTSIYGPKTRICITTTPLCHVASFVMCNVARLRPGMSVLDPFAGSCATLLAASHIMSTSTSTPSTSPDGIGPCCRTVAIEIAHNGQVDRDDIVRDFVSRSLPPPLEIIHGDSMSPDVRSRARCAIGGGAFDVICTDPPYGIREAMSSGGEGGGDSVPPLTQLFHAMGRDRIDAGDPLLRVGGRLVAFVPVRKNERLEDCLPDAKARERAGLVMEGRGKEQVLSEILSRYLVSFICVS